MWQTDIGACLVKTVLQRPSWTAGECSSCWKRWGRIVVQRNCWVVAESLYPYGRGEAQISLGLLGFDTTGRHKSVFCLVY